MSVRTYMVGTPLSLVPPEGFVDTDELGLMSQAGARLFAEFVGVDWPTLVAQYIGDANTARLASLGLGTSPRADVMEVNGNAFVVFQGFDTRADSRRWIVFPHFEQTFEVEFLFPAAQGTWESDRSAVVAALESMRFEQIRTTAQGCVGLGLAMQLRKPFEGVETFRYRWLTIGAGVQEARRKVSATLSASHRHRPMQIGSGGALEGLAMASLSWEFQPTVHEKRQVRFCGVEGLRVAAEPNDYHLAERYEAIVYVGIVSGVPVEFSASGPATEMTDEVVSAIDEVALSIRRQTAADTGEEVQVVN